MVWISILFLLFANEGMSSEMHGTPKILIRIGLLYEEYVEYLAVGIHAEIIGYAQRYQVGDRYSFEVLKINLDTVTNVAETLRTSGLTAVFVASRRINCAELQDLFRVIPFYYLTRSIRSCDSDLDYNRIIHMIPSDSALTSTMLKTILQYGWTSATVLYQSNDEIQYTFQDMQDARDRGIDITAYEAVGSDESIRQKLVAARREGSRTYILVCSYTKLIQIMTIARDLRLSTSNNHWFIPNVLMNPLVLHDFLKDGVQITFMHSQLVTPLTLELLREDTRFNEDGHALYLNIILALSRIAIRSLVDACGKTQAAHHMYAEKDGACFSTVRSGHHTYLFCGPDLSVHNMMQSVEVTTTTETTSFHIQQNDTVETTKSPYARVQFEESCIIYDIDEEDVPPSGSNGSQAAEPAGHDHRRRRRQIAGSSGETMHGMGEASSSSAHSDSSSNTDSMGDGSSHSATTTSDSSSSMESMDDASSSSSHGDMVASDSSSSSGSTSDASSSPSHGDAMAGMGDASSSSSHGSSMTGDSSSSAGSTSDTSSSSHGDAMAEMGDASSSSSHGSSVTGDSSSNMDSMGDASSSSSHGGMDSTSDASSSSSHGEMAEMGDATSSSSHGSSSSVTGESSSSMDSTGDASSSSSHDDMDSTSDASSSSSHGGMAEMGDATSSSSHGSSSVTGDSSSSMDSMGDASSSSSHGDMDSTSDASSSSSHGGMGDSSSSSSHHGSSMTGDSSSNMDSMGDTSSSSSHGGTMTDSSSSHGDMTADDSSSNTNTMHGGSSHGDDMGSDSDSHGSTMDSHGGSMGSDSDSHGDAMGDASSSHGGGHGGHDELFSVAANFDPCPYASRYQWEYSSGTCSASLMSSLELMDSNSVFVIEHVHSIEGGHHELLAVGGYSGTRGEISVTYPRFKISQISLPSRELVVGVVWNPPWLSWEYDPESKLPVNGSYEGFLYDLLLRLSSSMEFNFTINEDTAIEFGEGYNHTEEQLESRMNSIFDDDLCDFILYPKTIHGGRLMLENVVGTSTSFQQPSMYLITKRVERDQNVSIWQFLTPFREESWFTLYASLFMVSFFMAYVNKHNPNEFRIASRDLREGAKPSEHMGILNSLWFNFSVLVEQGSQIVPRSKAMKIISGFWWFFVMLVVSAYTANMISFMTQTDNAGITTIEELVGQQEVDYGLMSTNPILSRYLPQARSAPYSTMWEQLKNKYDSSVLTDFDEALKKVDQGNFILVATFKEVVKAVSKSCNFDKVGDGFYKQQFGFPVPRGWQFLPMFNDHLARLYDKGVVSDFEDKWFGDIESNCETATVSATAKGQLDLKAFIGMYVLLLLGIATGVVVCFFEIAYVKYGGFGGMLGRAKKYEFRTDHSEHQKPDKLMEKEFEKWPGGWDVHKHRPFVNTISDILEPRARQASTATTMVNRSSLTSPEYNLSHVCCPECGQ